MIVTVIKRSIGEGIMTKTKVRVLIVSCKMLTKMGLSNLLRHEKWIDVVKEVDDLKSINIWIKKGNPNIVLICQPLMQKIGLDLILKIIKERTNTKLIVFDSDFSLHDELMLIKRGVHGVVSSNSNPDVLVKAVKKVYSGEYWVRREVCTEILNLDLNVISSKGINADAPHLTKREWEVLSLLASGYSNQKIASNLFISEATVKSHINHIYKKLNVHDRVEAALIAQQQNLCSTLNNPDKTNQM